MPSGRSLTIPTSLAVEVTSPDDAKREELEKVAEWLRAGTKAVIVLDPNLRTAEVHRPDGEVQSLHADDRLTVPEVLPSWPVPLNDISK
jgi:Uma2 family endonuclease